LSPRVTVLMPMRNAGPFVAEAIASILAQSAHDFTFVIVDDGSDDDGLAIAARMADRRTEILHDGRQLGLVARLNWGLDHARTRYVARMDADDVAAPKRLACQLAFMAANPEVGICGSWYALAKPGAPPVAVRLPLGHESLRALTLFASPFAHPTVMFDLGRLDAAGLRYSDAATHAEDYDLWERACSKTRLANVPAYLLRYRLHPDQVSAQHRKRQRDVSDAVRRRALGRLGFDPASADATLHCDYAASRKMHRLDRMEAARAWLARLERRARQRGDRAVAAECAARERKLDKRIAELSPPGHAARLRRLLRLE
jgi:glycosyltransferase involved in cell wall biosynthesis